MSDILLFMGVVFSLLYGMHWLACIILWFTTRDLADRKSLREIEKICRNGVLYD